MAEGVHITVFNTGWVKADNRVILSSDEKNMGMPALCALIEHPTQWIFFTIRVTARIFTGDKGMGFENHD